MQKGPENGANTEEAFGPEAGLVSQSFPRHNRYLIRQTGCRLQLLVGVN